MPVYLITVHTYRSWGEDHPRGYVQRGERGVKRPSARLAAHRNAIANDPPIRLNKAEQRVVLDALHEVCLNLGAQLYVASCTPTHWHLLVGWVQQADQASRDGGGAPHVNAGPEYVSSHSPGFTSGAQSADAHAKQLATRLKRVVGMKLSKHHGTTGNKWFSRGWDLTRVEDSKHFNHLAESYLPKHTNEGGLFKSWPINPRM